MNLLSSGLKLEAVERFPGSSRGHVGRDVERRGGDEVGLHDGVEGG